MKQNTSWGKVSDWYNKSVGEKGNYFHREVILPNVLRLLKLKEIDRLLDLGCGQGVLARALPKIKEYLGIDLSVELIEEARKLDKDLSHKFAVSDVSKDIKIRQGEFTKVAIILALQNIKNQFAVIKNVERYMAKEGELIIVLNHPAFRIPKHADWEVDRQKNLQYRTVDSYLTPLTIPIDSSPFDNKNNQRTWSYHYPISAYSEMLLDNGLVIKKIEEWISPKVSEGGMAKIEDAARKEFPMFMCIVAVRK
ncbi:MAG: class I SAM-dependent methyltransferase [Microgenomates group bacterium]